MIKLNKNVIHSPLQLKYPSGCTDVPGSLVWLEHSLKMNSLLVMGLFLLNERVRTRITYTTKADRRHNLSTVAAAAAYILWFFKRYRKSIGLFMAD